MVPLLESIKGKTLFDGVLRDQILRCTGAEEHTPFRLLVHASGDVAALEQVMREAGVRWLLHRRMGWSRQSYAALSDEEFEQAFRRPLALVDELLATRATRRWERGDFTIYELPPSAD